MKQSYFRFFLHAFFLPPVARLLCMESREIPNKSYKFSKSALDKNKNKTWTEIDTSWAKSEVPITERNWENRKLEWDWEKERDGGTHSGRWRVPRLLCSRSCGNAARVWGKWMKRARPLVQTYWTKITVLSLARRYNPKTQTQLFGRVYVGFTSLVWSDFGIYRPSGPSPNPKLF